MNIRTCLILTAFFLTCTTDVNAQITLGIDVGVTNNKLNINYDKLKVTSREGYMINLMMKYRLDKWLALETSPGIIQKNYSVKNINNIYQNIDNTYLHLPLSIQCQVYILKNIILSGSSGVYYAYWVTSRISGVAPNIFELSTGLEGDELIRVEDIKYKYSFTRQDNKSEFGGLAKLGFTYQISDKLSFLINGHYYLGITSQKTQIKEIQHHNNNETTALTSGLSYRL